MSWLFSQALEAVYSEANSSGGPRSARLNVMPTPQPFWHKDKPMESWGRSRFGLTSRLSTAAHGEALLTWFREDFLARTSAPLAKVPASPVPAVGCGQSSLGSLARFDPDSRSWKTHQFLLAGGSELFSETWPRWSTAE